MSWHNPHHSADPTMDHWIVVGMSKHRKGEGGHPKFFFRHESESAAEKEAERLAKLHPGKRFSVYGCGMSFKEEREIVSK